MPQAGRPTWHRRTQAALVAFPLQIEHSLDNGNSSLTLSEVLSPFPLWKSVVYTEFDHFPYANERVIIIMNMPGYFLDLQMVVIVPYAKFVSPMCRQNVFASMVKYFCP